MKNNLSQNTIKKKFFQIIQIGVFDQQTDVRNLNEYIL